jgi:exodeoxyribonuclease III
MIVATFNANSIRVRLEQVLAWIALHEPDVLALQETKVPDDDFPAEPFRAAGYHVVYRGQKSHAGVALASKLPPEQVSFGLDDGPETDEPRLLAAVVGGLPIINTYVPQGRTTDSPHFLYKLAWLRRLRDYVDRRYRPDSPLLWVGDINVAPEPIDVYDPVRLALSVDYHPEARAALAEVLDWGFVDVFRALHPAEPGHYTYWDYRLRVAYPRNLGWRIDHIFATEPLAARCRRAWIDREARGAQRPSDHTFLVADFDLWHEAPSG